MIESPHSLIRHLAYAISPNHDPDRCEMAIFSAYFDASGRRDAPQVGSTLFVSGFVATVNKWARFESAWPELLEKHKVPTPFHMADFMREWKNRPDECNAFRMEAVGLLKLLNKPFSAGVCVSDLTRLFDEYDVPAHISRQPYPWCAMHVVDALRVWAGNRFNDSALRRADTLQLVFEHGDQDQGLFADALWEKYHLEADFRTNRGKGFIPFAACDFLAWEFRAWAVGRRDAYEKLAKAQSYVHAQTRMDAIRRAGNISRFL